MSVQHMLGKLCYCSFTFTLETSAMLRLRDNRLFKVEQQSIMVFVRKTITNTSPKYRESKSFQRAMNIYFVSLGYIFQQIYGQVANDTCPVCFNCEQTVIFYLIDRDVKILDSV
jgi:hypothetical protein